MQLDEQRLWMEQKEREDRWKEGEIKRAELWVERRESNTLGLEKLKRMMAQTHGEQKDVHGFYTTLRVSAPCGALIQ